MNFDSGSFRLYHTYHTQGKTEDHLIGRFFINKGNFFILEDHDSILETHLPEGKMDDKHKKMLWSLAHSAYYKILHEDDVNEGNYPSLIEDLDIGPTDPDAEFIVTGKEEEPLRLEMFADSAVLDGRRLSDDELTEFMGNVHSGAYKLTPI